MADAQTPGDYFVGRPVNYEEKQEPAATNEENAEITPDGHHEQQRSLSAPGDNKKVSIFGNLFSCLSGSRAES